MRKLNCLLLLACGLPPLAAQAQVVKCTDPATGQVTYTDDHCAAGATGRHVMDKPSADQLAAREAEAERARLAQAIDQAQREAMRPSTPYYYPPAPAPSQASNCAQARSSLDAASNYKYVTPQASATLVAQAQQRVDTACAEPAPRVHVVRRYVPVTVRR